MDEKRLDEIISRYDYPSGRILGILRDIQVSEGYIEKDLLRLLAEKIEVPVSRLYGLVTFYSFFSLQPVGRHIITLCMGTPCHVKGARTILATLEDLLGIKGEEESGKYFATTADNQFTVVIARCFGACSMSPVIQIDGNLYGYVTPEKIPEILAGYGWHP
ncbi:MAG: NAD(P)H-dependent oxidoreductase subunit E [Methanospirillaceae archaeon]|nr:NAD(P)H-dependent oxidoreductase subunit E [Methanospirillaceae archaeon]